MIQLYGKDNAIRLISSMIERGRLSHAFIVFGEKGVGKKTLCKYIAKQVLCQNGAGLACGVCRACVKIEKNIHPDFIEINPGGKNGNYLSDELRAIVSDAAIAPNESEKKIYFLPGIDKSLPEAQNMLLKIVEEPPDHVMFLMTAESKEKILPTVLSRVISIGLNEPDVNDCKKALSDMGFKTEDIEDAVKVFGGNIGRCTGYILKSEDVEYVVSVKKIVDAIVAQDEFLLLGALCSIDPKSGRDRILDVLAALKEVMRDVLADKLGAELCSVCRDEARTLSKKLRQSGAEKIYEALSTAEIRIAGNALVPLALSDLCGNIAANF